MSCRDEIGKYYSLSSPLPLEASLPAGSMYLTGLSTRKEAGLRPCEAQHCLHPDRWGHCSGLQPGLLQSVLMVTHCSLAVQLSRTLSWARTQVRQRSAMYRPPSSLKRREEKEKPCPLFPTCLSSSSGSQSSLVLGAGRTNQSIMDKY